MTLLQLIAILKWDRNQPRGPKGTRTGGRWVKDVSQAQGTAEASFKPPEYGWGSTENRRMAAANQASYAAIMNAPTGTGFSNTPRGPELEAARHEAALAGVDANIAHIEQLIESGEVKDTTPGVIDQGANDSVLVVLEHSSDANEYQGVSAIYKPEVGEAWTGSFSNSDIPDFIHNRRFSLAEREAVAYEVSDALGLGLVPITKLRTSLEGAEAEARDPDANAYDPDDLRQMYEEYEEKARDDAYDAVSGEMGELYQKDLDNHIEYLNDRHEEVVKIWNEVIQEFPEDPHGPKDALREHPVLPMGSKTPFEREASKGVLDPLDVFKEADVDVSSELNHAEEDRIREFLRHRIAEGYEELGDIDPDAAREAFDYGEWVEQHADTEGRLLESKIKSYDSWKQARGYKEYGESSNYGGIKNREAPHPNGGSLQHYQNNVNSGGYLSEEDGARMAVFDYVIGTMDRHGSNLLYNDADDSPVAIDNGYSMPAAGGARPDKFAFRSVAVDRWMGADNTDITREFAEPILKQLNNAVQWESLVQRHPNMNDDERDAFLGRIDKMKRALQTSDGLYRLWDQMERY